MFSKKENDLLIEYSEKERRNFYRVKPSRKEPVYISICDTRYQVKNIGAGGIGIYIRDEGTLALWTIK